MIRCRSAPSITLVAVDRTIILPDQFVYRVASLHAGRNDTDAERVTRFPTSPVLGPRCLGSAAGNPSTSGRPFADSGSDLGALGERRGRRIRDRSTS